MTDRAFFWVSGGVGLVIAIVLPVCLFLTGVITTAKDPADSGCAVQQYVHHAKGSDWECIGWEKQP